MRKCISSRKKRGTMQRHLLVVSPGRVATFATRRRALSPLLPVFRPLFCRVAPPRGRRVLVGIPFAESLKQRFHLAPPFSHLRGAHRAFFNAI
jgi:hypothetical protein